VGSLRIHLIAEGRVQGVFYRASARSEALSLGLTGWVRNLENGNVEIVAEGAAEKLEALAAWCRKGPPGALVTDLSVKRLPATGEFTSFDVLYR